MNKFIFLLVFLTLSLSVLAYSFSLFTAAQNSRSTKTALLEAPTPTVRPVSTISRKSSDGSIAVTIISEPNEAGEVLYTFTVNIATSSSQVYQVTDDPSVTYSLPENSWSPDNRQFFIIRNSPSGPTHLVFKASGAKYPNDQKFLDVDTSWTLAKHTNKIKSITGWGSSDLLIIETSKTDGSDGISYWFTTSSRKFLPLRN